MARPGHAAEGMLERERSTAESRFERYGTAAGCFDADGHSANGETPDSQPAKGQEPRGGSAKREQSHRRSAKGCSAYCRPANRKSANSRELPLACRPAPVLKRRGPAASPGTLPWNGVRGARTKRARELPRLSTAE
jgi:hypothetical protein